VADRSVRVEVEVTTEFVESADGTRIAFERQGSGPAVILVDGAMCYRANGPNGPLAALLARHFTVYTYDRRGRGESGDTAPYTVDREIDDLRALVKEAGASVYLYGISSGGALALEAVNAGLPVRKLALYEVPYVVDRSRKIIADDYEATLDSLVAAGKRGAAISLFMTKGIGLPGIVVVMMRLMPAWPKLKAVAHTLPYDTVFTAPLQRGRPLPADRWPGVTVPTAVIAGTRSQGWIQTAMRSLAGVLPTAEHRTLPGQTHIVKPAALAPVLVDFFEGKPFTR
jgi:pimeloyl-ACP methyl ester carboxylesterase